MPKTTPSAAWFLNSEFFRRCFLLIKVSCDGTTEGGYFTNLQKFEEENLQSRIARIETRHLIDYQKWLESQEYKTNNLNQ